MGGGEVGEQRQGASWRPPRPHPAIPWPARAQTRRAYPRAGHRARGRYCPACRSTGTPRRGSATSTTAGSATSSGCSRTGRWAISTSGRRSRSGRSYAHLGPLPFHRLLEPPSTRRSRSSCPPPAVGDFSRGPGSSSSCRTARRCSTCAIAGHRVVPGKPPLAGLSRHLRRGTPARRRRSRSGSATSRPASRSNSRFTVFRDLPVIARHSRLRNRGSAPVRVQCAMSAVLDLPDATWEAVQLGGTWGREFHLTETLARARPPGDLQRARRLGPRAQTRFLLLRRPLHDRGVR